MGRALAWTYIELIRNTPLLVQILVCYFILAPALGMGRETTGVVCLALYEGAFAAEIIRGALQAVPKGQREASLSLGMTEADTARDIVWPQALPLMLPPVAILRVSLLLLRVTFSTPVTAPVIPVADERLLAPLTVALTVLP